MDKIAEEMLIEYVEDTGLVEQEYWSCGALFHSVQHTITQEDINLIKEGWKKDASDFLGVRVTLEGVWPEEEEEGAKWNEVKYEKVEKYEEVVAEVVIPEHTVEKTKAHPFVPVWE